MPTPKSILVIRLSAMGDSAMVVPVILALKKAHPQIAISVLTQPFYTPIFSRIPDVHIISGSIYKEHKGVLGLYKLSKELRKYSFDAIVDLHGVLRTQLLKIFLNHPRFVVLDKGRNEKKNLLAGRSFKPLKSMQQRYAETFKKTGLDIRFSESRFVLAKEKLATNTLSICGEKTKTWIGLAPFASYCSKEYPLENCAKLIHHLSKTSEVFLFGSPGHRNLLDSLVENKLNCINMAGKIEFNEELSLISQLDVMISMDSGNGHLAAMYGLPVITLWGVTHPYLGYTPYNQPSENAITVDRNTYPKIPTSVYGNKFPKAYEKAMESIDPKSILNRVNQVLQNKKTTF